MVMEQMEIFLQRFVKPNTLYAETGPVIETPMAAVSTLHELYMQDWGDKIRVFYGTPSAWQNASFINLRAKGAFLVSASRQDGKNVFIQVESEKGGLCRLQTGMSPVGIQVRNGKGEPVPFTPLTGDNGVIEMDMRAGDVVQVTDKTRTTVYPARSS